jgi:hypothetical protein
MMAESKEDEKEDKPAEIGNPDIPPETPIPVQDPLFHLPEDRKSLANDWLSKGKNLANLMAGVISGRSQLSFKDDKLHFEGDSDSDPQEFDPQEGMDNHDYDQLLTLSQPYGRPVDIKAAQAVQDKLAIPPDHPYYPLLQQWIYKAFMTHFIIHQLKAGNMVLMDYTHEHGPIFATTLSPAARAKMQAKAK